MKPGLTPDEVLAREAAELLRDCRVQYARAFTMHKVSTNGMPVTDKMAEQMAIETTQDAVTIAEAEYTIAMARLRR